MNKSIIIIRILEKRLCEFFVNLLKPLGFFKTSITNKKSSHLLIKTINIKKIRINGV